MHTHLNAALRQRPSQADELREAVLTEHRAIRRILVQVEELTRRLEEGEILAEKHLRSRLLEMTALMDMHFEMEELVFRALYTFEQPEHQSRLAEIDREHCEQRDFLHSLAQRLLVPPDPAYSVVDEARAFLKRIHEDMRREEETFLQSNYRS